MSFFRHHSLASIQHVRAGSGRGRSGRGRSGRGRSGRGRSGRGLLSPPATGASPLHFEPLHVEPLHVEPFHVAPLHVAAALVVRYATIVLALALLFAACSPLGGVGIGNATPTASTPTHTAIDTPAITPTGATTDRCPPGLEQIPTCQTPHSMRVAYGVESLTEHGFTGKGQTVVDIVSFGSPTLQQDMTVFDQQFGLPPVNLQVISPIHEPVYDPNHDMGGWASETTLDVQIIHALAPGANIVVLTSPVAETEGTVGLPEFRQLIQYAITHHLGSIISNSWGASEVTLKNTAGQQELHKWDSLLQQATTQQGITFFAASGDNGATDYTDLKATRLSPTPTTSFVDDEPWVTSCGGTTLQQNGVNNRQEVAWNRSGGGFSAFYAEPSFQQTLPAAMQGELKHRRGVPDVAGDADPNTGLAIYMNGQWGLAGGTSASAPLWAALGAIANQMAGHALGFINPGLYKVASTGLYTTAFHDITVGNNSVEAQGVMVQGYPAVPGWDPITGLGSPDAQVLLPALIAALKVS